MPRARAAGMPTRARGGCSARLGALRAALRRVCWLRPLTHMVPYSCVVHRKPPSPPTAPPVVRRQLARTRRRRVAARLLCASKCALHQALRRHACRRADAHPRRAVPELPEVESARGLLQRHVAGRTITRVTAADDQVRTRTRATATHARAAARCDAPAGRRCRPAVLGCPLRRAAWSRAAPAPALRRRTAARVASRRAQIVNCGFTPAQLSAALTGARVVAIHRKGKHLWCVRSCMLALRCRNPYTSPAYSFRD